VETFARTLYWVYVAEGNNHMHLCLLQPPILEFTDLQDIYIDLD